jgi:hypothetical protein
VFVIEKHNDSFSHEHGRAKLNIGFPKGVRHVCAIALLNSAAQSGETTVFLSDFLKHLENKNKHNYEIF